MLQDIKRRFCTYSFHQTREDDLAVVYDNVVTAFVWRTKNTFVKGRTPYFKTVHVCHKRAKDVDGELTVITFSIAKCWTICRLISLIMGKAEKGSPSSATWRIAGMLFTKRHIRTRSLRVNILENCLSRDVTGAGTTYQISRGKSRRFSRQKIPTETGSTQKKTYQKLAWVESQCPITCGLFCQ